MTCDIAFRLEQLSAVRTGPRRYVGVYIMSMSLQGNGSAETFLTHRTLVRLVRPVDAHVGVESSGLTERPVTHVTFVRFLSAVSSAVLRKKRRPREPFAANRTFERFLAGMNSTVHRQLSVASETISALVAHVLAAVNVHMSPQILLVRKTFLTDATKM